MQKDERIQKIKELVKQDDYELEVNKFYKGENRKLKVYRINTKFVIFNQYNGRIGTFVKTYEKFKQALDASIDEHEEIIINALWNSNKIANKTTKKDIEEKGQREPGIITQDGVVVDGNRRCMCQKLIAKDRGTEPAYFLAAILPDTLDSAPKEIKRLETVEQMGIDEKVDYSPIEKYVKVKDLQDEGFSNLEIATMMGEKEAKIDEYERNLKNMDAYLENLGRAGMYTTLAEQKREGPFVDFTSYKEKHKNSTRIDRDWTPDPEDIGEMEEVYRDFIRAGFGAQQGTRAIANPAGGKGVFSHKKIWEKFATDHFKIVEEAKKDEKSFQSIVDENPQADPTRLAMAQDDDFKDKVAKKISDNLDKYQLEIQLKKRKEEPTVYLQRAYDSLQRIEKNSVYDDKKSAKAIFNSIRLILNNLEKNLEE